MLAREAEEATRDMRTRLRRTEQVRSRRELVIRVAARGPLLEHVVATRVA